MGDQGVPTYVLVVDSVGLILAILGFCMAFRQKFVRKLFRQARHSTEDIPRLPPHEDPVRYALLISGIMVMVFGIVIAGRSEEHTSELQSLMRISYAVFCLKKKKEH